jgi:hypothetical protein
LFAFLYPSHSQHDIPLRIATLKGAFPSNRKSKIAQSEQPEKRKLGKETYKRLTTILYYNLQASPWPSLINTGAAVVA